MACDKRWLSRPRTENEAETLARLAECDAENAKAPATGGQHAPDPRSLRCLHSTAVERFSASFSRRAPVGLFMELVY